MPSAEPSTREAIAAVAGLILEFGRGWMLDPDTVARANELGLEGVFGFWVNGRAGVLGDVDADVAAAAIGFMHPDLVRHYWEGRPAGMSGRDAVALYVEAAADWGRDKLSGVPSARLSRLDELNNRVAAAALPSVGVLFAGWRVVDRPSDPAGAVTVSLNVVRELRGGAHLHAVHAVGLGPDGAIASTSDPVRGGASGLKRFGWPEPHPPADSAARAESERLTSQMTESAFSALDPAERAEYVDLVTEAHASMA